MMQKNGTRYAQFRTRQTRAHNENFSLIQFARHEKARRVRVFSFSMKTFINLTGDWHSTKD